MKIAKHPIRFSSIEKFIEYSLKDVSESIGNVDYSLLKNENNFTFDKITIR